MVARGDVLVSADDNGDIVVHKHIDGASFKLQHKITGHGSPCNCVDLWKNIIVAGLVDSLSHVVSCLCYAR